MVFQVSLGGEVLVGRNNVTVGLGWGVPYPPHWYSLIFDATHQRSNIGAQRWTISSFGFFVTLQVADLAKLALALSGPRSISPRAARLRNSTTGR